ncbi:hypothetical protein JN086_00890 [Mycolicibacterium austroafricanum]|uniref:Mammalian cell entry protein n=1 Tax=Mycolicibacterium austroafricanum TaxID=39687 RepID=A0ABT8H6Z1_MYCAO|nr:hypothetical protein [Mycolicibacterium austroafricanum]MDN4516531.1 hypothetical protein [Mycolicibacterium austroafricanum]QRZ07180.1 hypothetical protein JN090_00895 [Mycolicibacterium austroafricanum]QZT68665.1 hypothetical protein JN086_00890 [Mycolicibacterium austroafricanum]
MPDDEQLSDPEPRPEPRRDGVFSAYGIASAVLGVVAVAAAVLALVVWTGHRDEADELRYRTQVLQTAADWTGVLINMNSDTVDADMAKLHDGTVGQLNADFETAVEPYRKLVQTLRSRTTGQIDSVAIETIHHADPGSPPQEEGIEGFASRTDTVMVVATSLSENAGTDEPRTVRWTLRLDVTHVDGKLAVSRLEPIR